MQDEFDWSRQKSAWSFGTIVLLLGIPTVVFYSQGVFGEYDYWAGTVSLVVFALAESILFAWIFGMDRGWKEITDGAEITVPKIYRFIIRWVTPLFLLFVFIGSIFSPLGGDWPAAWSSLMRGNGWPLDDGSIIRQLFMSGLRDQIAAATDPVQKAALEDRLTYIIGARILLTAAFLGICYLVYLAYKRRRVSERSR
jgi:hypothetical protein